MKTVKLLVAVAMAAGAVLLMASIVAAAPASTTGVQTSQVFDSPILTDTVPVLTGTVPMTHPVGIAIALYFDIPYTQVIALHDQGFGFGVIARAYLTALASNGTLTPTQLLDMHQAGVGWGQIKKDFGVRPGGNGLGTIMRNNHSVPEPVPPASTSPIIKPGGGASGCPGNSCNAPGQNKPPKGPKPDTPKGPKTK